VLLARPLPWTDGVLCVLNKQLRCKSVPVMLAGSAHVLVGGSLGLEGTSGPGWLCVQ
jgi:hypothetical protein